MEVLITGGNGKVGTAIINSIGERPDYNLHILDVNEAPDSNRETIVANVEHYDGIRPAFENIDVVIHLAVYPGGIIDENWERIKAVNVEGTRNVLRAAEDAEVEKVIFASTNHVFGMYEEEHKPEIYEPDHDLSLDSTSPPRPDSTYAVSKLYGENDGRLFVENMDYPEQFYAIRICSLRGPEYDHPYADAEAGVENGEFERGSEEYELRVKRMKAMWFSRRDCGQMIDKMIQDDDTQYGVYSGVSGNDRRWFSIENARRDFGYDPEDNGETWDAPPE